VIHSQSIEGIMNSEFAFLESLTQTVVEDALTHFAVKANSQATSGDPITGIERYLLTKYQRWRDERNIACDFEADIRHLLSFHSIRMEVCRVLFQSIGQPAEQIDIAATLLIQAAYHRHRLRSETCMDPISGKAIGR
jgi:hypothetical protein